MTKKHEGKSGKIAALPGGTTFTPEQALDSAKQIDFDEVLIVGISGENRLVVRSSRMNRENALWLLELARLHAIQKQLQRFVLE